MVKGSLAAGTEAWLQDEGWGLGVAAASAFVSPFPVAVAASRTQPVLSLAEAA